MKNRRGLVRIIWLIGKIIYHLALAVVYLVRDLFKKETGGLITGPMWNTGWPEPDDDYELYEQSTPMRSSMSPEEFKKLWEHERITDD